ncbi:hypothetical protein AMES_8043 [Amycolatopsis mediterranei S699]|uniref:Secreted protein n=2 Tax=Amycolatopsis mediterranei TaxID=33910 RepID=A0A0H3DIC3_AMYMU|nr:hypothetical protein [Amycolatopsis mediterranei]ADJ49868.1 hypothetical protein AMED_8168 [Amycolatopsis mediterranei U32]AEK46858.1 hypothetical protein RAM_41955 [Amycolatopsis mediterranei S699]AFO81576.1 hypothetical protein AMES_8043 [Amycolatopsis mediterranei S699]AGT88705.1 hypothetical protein B737_8044 [Amycolatopsis mediterranei RB]KDO07882.1 hypothetical protein DV26_26720 [Amycolatopsis mediterranei]
MSIRHHRFTLVPKIAAVCAVATGICLATAVPGDADTKGTVASTVDATIRNAPPGKGAGYVIGNALTERGSHPGVTFTQVTTSGEFRYGRVHGNVDFCGWVSTQAKLAGTKSASSAKCPGGTDGRALLFRQFSNGLRNCEPGHCSGGSYAKVEPSKCSGTYPKGAPAFGNVSPWLPKAQPHDLYTRFTATYEVYWRYVSRDGAWVMVQDQHVRTGESRKSAGFDHQASDWYFVPRACVFDAQQKLHH